MIISDRYKFVCLNPPKTGTGWREHMLLKHNVELQCYVRNTDNRHDDLYKLTDQYADHDVIVVTRHPCDRVWSWWLMKERHGSNTGDLTHFVRSVPTQTSMIVRSGGFDRVLLFEFETQQQNWIDWFRTRHDYELHVPVPWIKRAFDHELMITPEQHQIIHKRELELIKHQQYII